MWLKVKEEKSKIVAGGQMMIGGKTANSIIINTPKGISIKVYFDAATGLPARNASTTTMIVAMNDARIAFGTSAITAAHMSAQMTDRPDPQIFITWPWTMIALAYLYEDLFGTGAARPQLPR